VYDLAEDLAGEWANTMCATIDQPCGYTPEGRRLWLAAARRFPQALAAFARTLPPRSRNRGLQHGLTHPLEPHSRQSWLDDWISDLVHLRCRIPPGIDPGKFLALAQIHMQPPVPGGYATFCGACDQCGLRRPTLIFVNGRYAETPWP